MRASVRAILLALACSCVPLLSTAQSQRPSSDTVSVRELSIPANARRAFQQGMKYLEKKDPAGSLPHFQQAVLKYPGYYEAFDRTGAAQLKLFHVAEAEQAFRKSIEVSGGQFAHPLIALGAILDGREQFGEAESVTRKGLALEPDSWTGHYYLGLAMLGMNRLHDAEQSLRESLRWKSDFAQAHLMLAEVHAREKDYRSLLTDLDEYLRLDPDGPSSARAKALRESVVAMMATLRSPADPVSALP